MNKIIWRFSYEMQGICFSLLMLSCVIYKFKYWKWGTKTCSLQEHYKEFMELNVIQWELVSGNWFYDSNSYWGVISIFLCLKIIWHPYNFSRAPMKRNKLSNSLKYSHNSLSSLLSVSLSIAYSGARYLCENVSTILNRFIS